MNALLYGISGLATAEVDGQRAIGTRAIARALGQLQPDPRFPQPTLNCAAPPRG